MTLATRTWIATHQIRRRVAQLARRSPPDREAIVREFAPGRSWLDAGCMWSANGRIAFAAEEAGASRVTGVDMMEETPEYRDEHARRGSAVRFVRGDIHDAQTLEAAGVHDVVWCSGVLYHSPNPVDTLLRLRAVTGSMLLLATEILPEMPGVRGACVLYPSLGDAERRAYAPAPGGRALGVTAPFDPERGYANWFWGITPSALDGLLRLGGFAAPERSWRAGPFHLTVAARPVDHDAARM